jgi:hypothetical protein
MSEIPHPSSEQRVQHPRDVTDGLLEAHVQSALVVAYHLREHRGDARKEQRGAKRQEASGDRERRDRVGEWHQEKA